LAGILVLEAFGHPTPLGQLVADDLLRRQSEMIAPYHVLFSTANSRSEKHALFAYF
jgi:hypothetical protein